MHLPSVFISHGSPMFALEPGHAGALLRQFGQQLGKPQAILVVSAHWITSGIEVCSAAKPETIHDFGGFPQELFSLQYPADGSPYWAQQTVQCLRTAGLAAELSDRWGLDHGTWVPLLHLYPDADIPVFQVSMPRSLDSQGAFALGQALRALTSQGVLVIGSGSVTHNLGDVFGRSGATDTAYAQIYLEWLRNAMLRGDTEDVIHSMERAPHAHRAHPTTEHFLPLLVAYGAAKPGAPVQVLDGGMRMGVLSMESYVFGEVAPST